MTLRRMSNGLILVSLAGLAFSLVGCANSAVVADSTTRGGRVYGEAGITGNKNTFTVERGSRIHHFSIIGDDNQVLVEDGAWIQKVEVWGRNNTISVPEHTTIRMTEVGRGNQIERRPSIWNVPALEAAEASDGTMMIRDYTPPPAPATATPYITTPPPASPAADTAAPSATGTNYTAPPAGRPNP